MKLATWIAPALAVLALVTTVATGAVPVAAQSTEVSVYLNSN